MVLEVLASALSSQLDLVCLDLVSHKPELPALSKLIFSQMPPPWSISAQISSGFICTSTHRVSALVIIDIRKNCNWAGKFLMRLCP